MFDGHGADSEDVFDIPVIQASLDASLDSHDNEAVGRAVSELRKEGILILSGGLTVHTFEDRTCVFSLVSIKLPIDLGTEHLTRPEPSLSFKNGVKLSQIQSCNQRVQQNVKRRCTSSSAIPGVHCRILAWNILCLFVSDRR